MNRAHWRAIAAATRQICKDGLYETPGRQLVSIEEALTRAVNDTREHPPTDPLEPGNQGPHPASNTRFEVTTETTLEAARRLTDAGTHRVGALNFASARNPGGGFDEGAKAQEEDLAYASGLVACLEGREMYRAHADRQGPKHMYQDYLIHSPAVPIFRDDRTGELLEAFWSCGVFTCPAPNAKAYLTQNRNRLRLAEKEIEVVMRRRIGRLLTLARNLGYHRLVLGAWGCGVFECDPTMVARAFAETFDRSFRGTFQRVAFAIKETDPNHPTVVAFRKAFPS